MRRFEELCPQAPQWMVPWDRITEAFEWAQDTQLEVESLAAQDEWRSRPEPERVRLFAAVLLLESARSARRLLWELGVPIPVREHIVTLVRHRHVPLRDLDERTMFRISLVARNDDLALLTRAELLSGTFGDATGLLDNVEIFRLYAREKGCLDGPRAFPSDHARFEYFRNPNRDPEYAAYDDTRTTVTVMSGLPASGKDHWVAANRPGVPVVSLDALRAELNVSPSGDQGPVIAAAHSLARGYLRAGEPFVWNATNVTRRLREQCIALMAGYRARVELVSLEAPPHVIRARNASRARPVPEAVVAHMISRWETPDVAEAHSVTLLENG
jgi:predicted kinase